MKVLIVEPGKYPAKPTLNTPPRPSRRLSAAPSRAVYPWRDSACIVCSLNGMQKTCRWNRMLSDYDIIHGTFSSAG